MFADINHILKELLEVQKENLEVERQRLELEKQKLEFERFVGSQLLTFGPFLGNLFEKYPHVEEPEGKKATKRPCGGDFDVLKDSKLLKNLLTEGIRKYMMGENDDSDNEDSGIQNDENSNGSK